MVQERFASLVFHGLRLLKIVFITELRHFTASLFKLALAMQFYEGK